MNKVSEFITVKELPESERPYEKCEQLGAEALSDAELLAVIIKNGTKGQRSVDLARSILRECSPNANPAGLDSVDIAELTRIRGVGKVKAIQIKCAAELGRRIALGRNKPKLDLRDPRSVADYYRYRMSHLDREVVMLLHADGKGRIFSEERLSVGTVDCSLISPREIFVSALAKRSVNIFLLHNHPSGDPQPSEEDYRVTRRVSRAGELIGIKLLDHVIIGGDAYVSFNELGVLA